MRTLIFDIETSPIISYNWGVYEQNALEVIEDWQILCFAYKWLGERRTKVVAQCDFDDYVANLSNDKNVVTKLWELLNEADAVITHNGDRFDIKKVNARFLVHGINPPEPFRSIDTLKVAKKVAAFSSNKLDSLCKSLGIGAKLESGGVETFIGALNGETWAWKILKKYNKVDVDILEELYLALRPWIDNHPSLSVYNDMPDVCPKCGHSELRQGGFFATKVGKRKRYQCLDCGGWCSGRVIEKTEVKFIN